MSFAWCIKMAWREFRSHQFRLLFISFCMALGFGAYIATNGFSSKVRSLIKSESRILLGGDIAIQQSPLVTPDLLDVLSNQKSVNKFIIAHDATTMAQGMRDGKLYSRLIEVRTTGNDYPLVGEFKATPKDVLDDIDSGIVIDKNLAVSWKLSIASENTKNLVKLFDNGQAVKVAEQILPVIGIVEEDSSRNVSAFALGPRAYVSEEFAKKTQIIGAHSRSTGRVFIKLNSGVDADRSANQIAEILNSKNIRGARIRSNSQATGSVARPIRNLNIFLDQIGLATFFIAVAGSCLSALAYLRSRRADVAVLRCLGALPLAPTYIFMLVMLIVCGLSVVFGVTIGYALGHELPNLLSDFLPLTLRQISFSLPPVFEFFCAFLIIALLLMPQLVLLQTVKPLSILQTQESYHKKFSWFSMLCYTSAVFVSCFLIIWRSPNLQTGISIAGGLVSLLLLFYMFNKSLMIGLKKFLESVFLPLKLAFGWLGGKQSLSGIVMSILGLAVFLSLFIRILRDDFVKPLANSNESDRPNIFLADVQKNQLQKANQILQSYSKHIYQAPFVRGRFTKIGLDQISNLDKAEEHSLPNSETENSLAENANHLKTREQNMTYRFDLIRGERIVDGQFWSSDTSVVAHELSLEKRFAERIGAKVGDNIEIDIAGRRVDAKVTSLRSVNWQTLQPNFFVVAHPSLLKAAPQTYLLAADLPSIDDRSELQIKISNELPTVSVIDTTEVAGRIWSMFEKIGFVADILSLFIFISSLFILGASLVASRLGRAQDIAIIRTLGGTETLLKKAILTEFLIVGLGASLIGAGFAVLSAHLFSQYVFEWDMQISILPSLIGIIVCTLLVVGVGWGSSIPLLKNKPMRILNSDS